MTDTFPQVMLAWLLTYALHSTVLLGVTLLVLRTRRVAPAVSDVMWKAALVGAILSASTQSLLDRRPAGSFALGGAEVSPAASAVPSDPTAEHALTELASAPAPTATTPSTVSLGEAAGDLRGGSESAATERAPRPSATLVPMLALGWLLAAVVFVAWYVGRRLILVGRLGDRRAVAAGPLPTLLATLRLESQARVPVRLTASPSISSPVALAGEICLPEVALVDLDAAQQRAMLAHELAHIERRDPQWLAFACIIERMFFFQPLNRFARAGMQESAEYLADEWAVRHTGGVPLAKALVKVAEWIQASPLGVPVAGFAEERSQLTVRVTRLLDGAAGSGAGSGVTRAVAVGAAASVLMLTAAFAPGVQARASSAPATESASGLVAAPDAGQSESDVPAMRGEEGRRPTDTTIVRAVIARLSDEDAEVRRAAADALGRMQHQMAVDPLAKALDDEDREVRRAALHALGNYERLRFPAAPIRKQLAADDAESRAQAVRLLGELRDRTSIPTITQLLMDLDPEVRQAALSTLDDLEAAISDDLLLRAMEDRSSDVRSHAVSIAGERQVLATVPMLVRLLDDRSSDVRVMAAEALTEMRTETAHNALKKAMTHKDPEVRRVAVEYFGEEHDK